MRKSYICLGLGWGDEGKGITTDYLSQHGKNSLVIRFSGGHQAGHTVVTEDGTRHVFSTFGAGTLSGIPTYWSSYCTFLPSTVLKEYKALVEKGTTPTLYVDAFAPVTTFYDYMLNQFKEKSKGNNRHGSCGVGFGTTVKRNTKTPYTFFVQDLLNPLIAKIKLQSIEKYYLGEINNMVRENPTIPASLVKDFTENLDFEKATIDFLQKAKEVLEIVEVVQEKQFFATTRFDTYVFEGSQGILLDQTHGLVYPHVTMSNTTSENALSIIERNNLPKAEIFYITRCYQTRHGNGFMSNENRPIKLKNNEKETNVLNDYQGNFRTGILDVDMINHAIAIDNKFSYGLTKNISITCLDQVEDVTKIPYTLKGEEKTGNPDDILIDIDCVFYSVINSFGDKTKQMNKIKIYREDNIYHAFNPNN